MTPVKDLSTEGDVPMAQINQVAEGIYRISSYAPDPDMSFNQFLIDDEHPALIHTGTYPLYEDVRQAVAEILDPSRLAYIIVPHFEGVESQQAYLIPQKVARNQGNLSQFGLPIYVKHDMRQSPPLVQKDRRS